MNLLSLDQSSHCSGYAIFRQDKLIHYGHFTFDDTKLDTRLYKIKKQVIELIEKYDIDTVVYEDIQQQSNVANNVATFKALAEVYGVISELLEEIGIPHFSTLATTWKSGLKIKGRTRQEQKKNAQQYVLDNLNVKATQDESDAICIGLHYLKICQERKVPW